MTATRPLTRPTSEGVVPWPADVAAGYRAAGLWRGRLLHEELADAFARRPDHVALVDGDVRLTHAELADRVEAGAARLVAAGLRADDRLLVQLPNGWQFVVLLAACLRAGVVPVLALPAHRSLELTALAEVAEARAIAVPDRIKDFDHRVLADEVAAVTPSLELVLVQGEPGAGHLDLTALLAPGAGETPAPAPTDPSAVALFLLSGGTTGLPKLIARTHDDYTCNIRACTAVAALDQDSVYLVALPAGHNFALGCPGFLGALLAGGTVVTAVSPDPARVLPLMAATGVTVAAAVPAVAQRWIDAVVADPALRPEPLRVLQVGGSRMPDDVAVRVEPVLGARLQQVFGMAEGLINTTRLDDPVEVITTTQGRPVTDADEVRVVDADGADLPDGERGAILTRGPYTPRGYYRAPEANARSFSDGWYASGDVVVRRPDGNLVVHGRDKDLVNRGGEKISAEEVESLAYRVPAVALCAAVGMPDPLLGERLCLYVVPHPGETVTLDDVRTAMTDAGIAAFKLPERLELVTDIPMTRVGKIDKRALREDIAVRTSGGNPS